MHPSGTAPPSLVAPPYSLVKVGPEPDRVCGRAGCAAGRAVGGGPVQGLRGQGQCEVGQPRQLLVAMSASLANDALSGLGDESVRTAGCLSILSWLISPGAARCDEFVRSGASVRMCVCVCVCVQWETVGYACHGTTQERLNGRPEYLRRFCVTFSTVDLRVGNEAARDLRTCLWKCRELIGVVRVLRGAHSVKCSHDMRRDDMRRCDFVSVTSE